MNRLQLITWLRGHPEAIHSNPDELLDRCERSVRSRAAEEAWLRAKSIIEEQARAWESAWGSPATEAYVAREVCHELAGELRHRLPALEPGSEERLAGDGVLEVVEPEAQELLRAYIHDLALAEEHRVWLEIVHYTNGRGRTLVREGRVSRELTRDPNHHYAKMAEKVTRILAEEYEQQAYRRA